VVAPGASGWIGSEGVGPASDTPLNKWTPLALTLEGGTATLYRNGVPIAVSASASFASGATNMQLHTVGEGTLDFSVTDAALLEGSIHLGAEGDAE